MICSSARTCNVVMILVLFLQWVAFTVYLQQTHNSNMKETTWNESLMDKPIHTKPSSSIQNDLSTRVEGVFATVLFRAPRWMHLRYTNMIHNALMNLPNHRWRVQLFLNRPWVDQELLPWHPGLERLLQDPRVIVTDIPHDLTKGKPKHVMASRWFWQAMAGEAIVLFSGNGAFCGNHYATNWDHFVQNVDFCGTPGRGGDVSTHSYRNRQVMLDAMVYAEKHQITPTGTEAVFIMKVLHDMQNEGKSIRTGTTDDMNLLGGVSNLTRDDGTLQRIPLLVSGTQARMTWDERDALLKHCPELKMIFPSMHEPACFGAHPNPAICKQSICALQDVIPRQGC